MRIVIGFDHRGVVLRDRIRAELEELGCEIVDVGTDSAAPRVDYPDKAQELAEVILRGDAERGVLVCSSGVGASIAASKHPGIRASVCHDLYSARQGVEHDAMNVLCLGSEIVGGEVAAGLVRMFVEAEFTGTSRHVRRLEKLRQIEHGRSALAG